MITSNDRSKWFGASDTKYMFMNVHTKTFQDWWAVKLGLIERNFSNKAMKAGNALEHKIIDAIESFLGEKITKGKRPVKIRSLRLRANYDGFSKKKVYEVKTTIKPLKEDVSKLPKDYIWQCQVLMWAKKLYACRLCYYRLTEEDYENYYLEVDESRLMSYWIEYDEKWINEVYLPRLRYLAKCLKEKSYPTNEGRIA